VHLQLVGVERGQRVVDPEVDRVAPGVDRAGLDHPAQDPPDVDGREAQRLHVRVQPGHEQQLLDQGLEVLGLPVRRLEEGLAIFLRHPAAVAQHRAEAALDRRERGPQLVRDHGDELVLGPVQAG
jgi:hypothetical protein